MTRKRNKKCLSDETPSPEANAREEAPLDTSETLLAILDKFACLPGIVEDLKCMKNEVINMKESIFELSKENTELKERIKTIENKDHTGSQKCTLLESEIDKIKK